MSARTEKGGSILIAEDDPDIAASLEMILTGEGYEVTVRHDGAAAHETAAAGTYDLVLTDFRMPGLGGLDLLQRLRELQPQRPVILMTAHGNTDLAIEATKRGAYDYLLKPFDIDELLAAVSQAMRASRTMLKRVRLGADAVPGQPGLIGECRAMQRVYKEIGRIAPTDATVLILGETGTGKELVARAIYQHSQRQRGPFVAVNCGAIPENLLESELFGHVRGAFTGATGDRVGRFEQAHGGTLFLDEIGDLPLPVQVKLLRVLQERRVQPLGGSREIPVDVRILAATHQPLGELIAAKRFREDLYYRINSAVISLPPLRERGEDLETLISAFAAEAAAEYGVPRPDLPKPAMTRLARHSWPGNVRELRNVVRQAVLLSRGYPVTPEILEGAIEPAPDASGGAASGPGDFASAIAGPVREALEKARKTGFGSVLGDFVRELERQLMHKALDLSGGHAGRVADWLGISRVTLRKKLAEHGIDRKKGERAAADEK
jgi:DNA-binding NtrC family response regulator